MPLEHLQQRWHFHQRMNKKVWINLERLKALIATNPSQQDILDALHPWRLSIGLRFNNTFAILQFAIGIISFFTVAIFFHWSALWLLLLWFICLALCGYAYLSFEKQSDIDHVIHELCNQVYQDQYQIKLNQFPNIDSNMQNPSRMLLMIRQGFECLNEGNASNSLESIAATEWEVDGKRYPVLLFHYKCVNETAVRDANGNVIRKEIVSHRWGACVFKMPVLAFVITKGNKRYSRYPIKWSTSDIQFNRQFNIYGQNELELARNLTPQRVLALAHHLEDLRGTLMFHDQMQAFCYVSEQNIFSAAPPNKPITDISLLRGYLRTFKAPHYEKMQQQLMAIIRQFQED